MRTSSLTTSRLPVGLPEWSYRSPERTAASLGRIARSLTVVERADRRAVLREDHLCRAVRTHRARQEGAGAAEPRDSDNARSRTRIGIAVDDVGDVEPVVVGGAAAEPRRGLALIAEEDQLVSRVVAVATRDVVGEQRGRPGQVLGVEGVN